MRKKQNLKSKNSTDDRLIMVTDAFKQSRHPVSLMGAFVEHVNRGLNPPPEVLQTIARAFEKVLQGSASLDEALELRGKGRGQWNAVTVAKKKATQVWLAHMMSILTKGCGLTEEEAADRLSFGLEDQKEMRRYSAAGLLDQYRRTWKKKYHYDAISNEDAHHPLNAYTPQQLALLLRAFPRPVDCQ